MGEVSAGGFGLRVSGDVPGPSFELGPLVAVDAGPTTLRFAGGVGASPTFRLLSAQAVVGSRASKLSPLSLYGGVRDELILGRDDNTNRIGVCVGFAISPPHSRWLVETEGIAYVKTLGGALALRVGYLSLLF